MKILTLGERGQIVIPKHMRTDLLLDKGSTLLVTREGDKITLRKISVDEDQASLHMSEESFKKTWDNTYDNRWDDVI